MKNTMENTQKIELVNFDREINMMFNDETNSQVSDILRKHGLDFTIAKVPLFAEVGDSYISSDYFGLLNTKLGKIINTCKDSYTISQNEDVVRAVITGMKPFGSGLQVENAGSLNDGRRTFIQLAVNGFGKVGSSDMIKKYVTIIDSNDGSTGLSVGIGDLTMSCQNQFFKFYKAGQSKFRHTASIVERIKEIPELISLALAESMKTIEIYNRFHSTVASRELVDSLVLELVGMNRLVVNEEKDSTRKINAMNSLYNHIGKEMSQKGNNVWGLHSGVTSWTTHEKSAPIRENGRIESLMVGTNYNTNIKSFDFALALL